MQKSFLLFPTAAFLFEKQLKEGINHMLFGIPEHVKLFNRIAKKFSASNNWSYLDFHKVCSKHGDPQSLFVPDDGVHMSLSGHQRLAETLLKYLSK